MLAPNSEEEEQRKMEEKYRRLRRLCEFAILLGSLTALCSRARRAPSAKQSLPGYSGSFYYLGAKTEVLYEVKLSG